MHMSWYSIKIALQNGGPIFYGYFCVNNETCKVIGFYETINKHTNFENNILGPLNNPWPETDNLFQNGYLSDCGFNFTSKTLQNIYNTNDSCFNIYYKQNYVLWRINILTTNIVVTPILHP